MISATKKSVAALSPYKPKCGSKILKLTNILRHLETKKNPSGFTTKIDELACHSSDIKDARGMERIIIQFLTVLLFTSREEKQKSKTKNG